MSGDLQVRKRKGKNKKKETEAGNARSAQGSNSQNGVSSYIDSSPEYSDVPTFEHTEELSDKPARNGSKKKRQQSPSKSASTGSGCCAKVIFVFLVTFLVILAALIFIQLHPQEHSTLVPEYQEFIKKPVSNDAPFEDVLSKSDANKALNLESIEEQIIQEEEAERASFMKLSPPTIDVEVPDYDSDARRTPVQEPPIVKETAHVLGNEHLESDAIKTEVNAEKSEFAQESVKAESSANNKVDDGPQLESNRKTVFKETGKSDATVPGKIEESKSSDNNPENVGATSKPKPKNKKARKAPPSPEEILAHQNTLDRGEMLMSAIEELSPNHPLLEELRPHLDGAKRDLKNLKLEGLETTTKHALIILEDLYIRLIDAKEKGELTTDHSKFFEEESQEQDQGLEKSVPDSPPVAARSDPQSQEPDSASAPSDSSATSKSDATFSEPIAAPETDDSLPHSAKNPSDSLRTESATAKDSVTGPGDSVTSPQDSVKIPSDMAPNSADSASATSDSVTATSADSVTAASADSVISTSEDPATATSKGSATLPTKSPKTAQDSTTSSQGSSASPKTAQDSTTSQGSSASPPAAKESAPRELSASRGDIGLEDLTEDDLASPIENSDQLLKLRDAEALRVEDPREALRVFTAIVREAPLSARAHLGRARCLDALAQAERSNARLEQAIASYRSVLDIAEERQELVSEKLLRASTNTLVDKLRFRGHLPACVRVHLRLLEIFPDEPGLRNQLGITYLLQGNPAAAQEVFDQILQRWPNDGLAQVHLGFILKTTNGNNADGARLMKEGIASGEPGTDDARFYFHLGDALHRLGRQQEAHQVYEEAAAKGLILGPTQRSLYNVNRLSAKPVWSLQETTYEAFFKKLEANWETIRNEGLALIADGFQPEAENLRDRGKWGQLELFSRGRQNSGNCVRAPTTCSIVGKFKPASGCRRGQVKFSLMEGGTHVWAHCGPTNCRLRAHLGLVIPKEEPVPVLRVENQYLQWKEGKIFVFDDSFEHEVWHNGTEPRLVLIVDLWHPELTLEERSTLAPV